MSRQESRQRTGQGGGRFRISPPSLDPPLIQTAKRGTPLLDFPAKQDTLSVSRNCIQRIIVCRGGHLCPSWVVAARPPQGPPHPRRRGAQCAPGLRSKQSPIALTSVTAPASVTSISDESFGYYDDNGLQKIDGFTIYGYPGTAAETYAAENVFAFVALEGFADVAESEYFFNPVMWAIAHKPPITAGVAPGYFGPNNSCTREQIVTFLWAANGKPAPAGTGSGFSDVPADAWYYKPVMWAVENKITSGMPDGSFGVGQPCTRAQAMTFLWASKGKPAPSSMESTFSDVSTGDWFCKAILWAAENGITKGIGDGLFGVNNTCTRAQIITFLYKAYK